jgi:hypothetical protein
MAPSAVAFSGVALFHFLAGYAWGNAVMAAPLTARLALFGIFLAGAFTRLALGVGTVEYLFAWAGPVAAVALADSTSSRNIAYAALAFLGGFALMSLAFLG